jgi:hypothetical protein
MRGGEEARMRGSGVVGVRATQDLTRVAICRLLSAVRRPRIHASTIGYFPT